MEDTHHRPLESEQVSERRWRWRRRIALVSLVGGMLWPVMALSLAFVHPDVDSVVDTVSWPFYMFVGANIGAYIGTAAWENVRVRQPSPTGSWENNRVR